MDMSRYIEKSIPPQAKLIAAGLGALTGCSAASSTAPTREEPDEDEDYQEQAPAFKKGEQRCFMVGNTPQWVTIDEDLKPGHMTVRATLPDGRKTLVDTEYLIEPSYCTR
jgi:hypothetical protein